MFKNILSFVLKCFIVSTLFFASEFAVPREVDAAHQYLCEDSVGQYYLDDKTIQYQYNRAFVRVNIVAAHNSGYSRSFQIQLEYNDGTPFLRFVENGKLSRVYVAHEMQWGVPAARWLVKNGYLKVK